MGSYIVLIDRARGSFRRAQMPDDFGATKESITVHEPVADTVDTGLVDRNGNAIHRRTMDQIGFVRFHT